MFSKHNGWPCQVVQTISLPICPDKSKFARTFWENYRQKRFWLNNMKTRWNKPRYLVKSISLYCWDPLLLQFCVFYSGCTQYYSFIINLHFDWIHSITVHKFLYISFFQFLPIPLCHWFIQSFNVHILFYTYFVI